MGQKDPGRKTKRRARSKPVDNELIELAEVLSEYQLDNNAYGWFRPPWRDGDWAIELAQAAALSVVDDPFLREEEAILWVLDRARHNNEAYETASNLYRSIIQPKVNTDRARLFAAALRCLQLKIANSHGGGAVYNEVLIPAFLPLDPTSVEKIVLEYRCRDSIGTTASLKGDRNDRQRAAFTTAWRRGLYLTAYAIQPAF